VAGQKNVFIDGLPTVQEKKELRKINNYFTVYISSTVLLHKKARLFTAGLELCYMFFY